MSFFFLCAKIGHDLMDTGYGRQGDYARHAYMTQGASFFPLLFFFSNYLNDIEWRKGRKTEREMMHGN